MVSNFERIVEEIRREARLIAPKHGLEPERLTELIMKIVDNEDQDRIKSMAGINQKAKSMIEDVALAEPGRGA